MKLSRSSGSQPALFDQRNIDPPKGQVEAGENPSRTSTNDNNFRLQVDISVGQGRSLVFSYCMASPTRELLTYPLMLDRDFGSSEAERGQLRKAS